MEKQIKIVLFHYSLAKDGVYSVMLFLPVGNVFLTTSPVLPTVHHHADAITAICLAFKRREKSTGLFNNQCAA